MPSNTAPKPSLPTTPPSLAQGSPFLQPTKAAPHVYAVPSLHGRSRFAFLVRRAFAQIKPSAIAIEFPPTLAQPIHQAVARLPALSVVVYADYDAELEKVHKMVPIAPGDSMVEALRLGNAHGVPVHFVDRDAVGSQLTQILLADDALFERLSLAQYWERAQGQLTAPQQASTDDLREREMAFQLQALGEQHQQVLFVCGMAHWAGVAKHLGSSTLQRPPVEGVPSMRDAKVYNIEPEFSPRVLGEMGWEAHTYELMRKQLHPQHFLSLLPLPLTSNKDWEVSEQRYQQAQQELRDLLAHTSAEGLYYAPIYDLLADIAQHARNLYQREWAEQPALNALRSMLRYMRNLALIQNRFAPSRYQFVLAAKGAINDDYAFQALRMVNHYPLALSEEEADQPSMAMPSDEAGEAEGESLILRLRQPRPTPGESDPAEELDLPENIEETEPGLWREQWEVGDHHVSHLPQDAGVEDFFQFVRKKCEQLLSDQQTRIQRMNGSMLDGLDLRETVRNLPLKQLYVRENLPAEAEIGPVVVIFHQPGEEHDYPHQMMWFAEHAWESDLALYSTTPGERLDGPGISRCRYGGVLSLVPPGHSKPVWNNPRYRNARSPAEVLLKAAIDQAKKPVVAYAAPQGPTRDMMAQAARKGVRILYVPLDHLPADMLKKARTFHILSGRELRAVASLYLKDK